MAKLSILIPARNEESLQRTIDDVFQHAEGDIEVLVALDNWDNPPILKENSRLNVIKTSLGQRGATNALAKIATSKYLAKLDAHVSFSQGFDTAILEDMESDTVIVPAICNLHVYDWFCPNGHKHFQGKYEECEQCGSKELSKIPIWQMIARPIRSNFYFDTGLHFQYMPEDTDELVSETMSLQGSCFVANRDKYFELNLCDEQFGSWGSQGTEVACKTWLSGGRVLSTKKAFYGHQFRETEGFPYHNPGDAILAAQKYAKDLFLGNKWPLQKYPIQWLIEKFNYPGDWTKEMVKELCTSPVDKQFVV